MRILPCGVSALEAAAAVLNGGGVAVIPTDTVYGLAASPSFPSAVERLYTIKGREAKKPIALLAADAAAAERFLGGALPETARRLAAKHWPGALTLVLPSASGAFEGLRVPGHDWTRELLRRCGGVLRVTSANLSGQRAATDAPQALADVGLDADLVVDGGVSPGGVASSVLKIEADGTVDVLRAGPKNVLRTVMKMKRRAFPAAARAEHARRLAEALLGRGDVRKAIAGRAPIAVYLASAEEADLGPFIEAALAEGARLVAPYWADGTYGLADLRGSGGKDGLALRSGPHGIAEPVPDTAAAVASEVAVWLVPGLAFTADGGRLGFGGGWYDRFLASAAPDAVRLGIAFPFQVLKDLPLEAHDIRLTQIVAGECG